MSAPLRVLVVDDEQPARARLVRLLEREPAIAVAAEADSGEDAILAVRRLGPDALFLDVQMPGCDGFEMLRRLRPAERPLVVFVTAWEQHALRAFEVHAVDYLLKPYPAARVSEACRRLHQRRHESREAERSRLDRLLAGLRDEGAPPGGHLDRFLVHVGERTQVVPCADVDWISAADNYAELHAGRHTHLLRGTLAALEDQLDPRLFARVHRSTLVNLTRVREIHPLFSGDAELVLEGGRRLRVSRSYRGELQRKLRGGG